jgi:hypothetical protein
LLRAAALVRRAGAPAAALVAERLRFSMGRVGEAPQPQAALTAAERDWLSWARSIPASAREAARYREPSFGGARAAPKAEAEARELYDAQQSLTKVCAALRVTHACDDAAPTCSRRPRRTSRDRR